MKFNRKNNGSNDGDLDVQLASQTQVEMARLVRELPEDVPSLAWRSDLNEKLRLQAAKVRRKKLVATWVLRPALGLGLASAAAVMMLTATSAPKPARQVVVADRGAAVADAIVRSFHDDVQNREVTPASVAIEPTPAATATAESTVDPYAEDVTDVL